MPLLFCSAFYFIRGKSLLCNNLEPAPLAQSVRGGIHGMLLLLGGLLRVLALLG